MLGPFSEVREMDDSIGKVAAYQEQTLAGSECLYARFVNDIDSKGLLRWSQSLEVQGSCFCFVCKKASAPGAFCTDDCRLQAGQSYGQRTAQHSAGVAREPGSHGAWRERYT